MAPLVHGLEVQYDNRIDFIYLDIDDPATESFKSILGYRSQPHFFLLDGKGEILHQWQGYVSVEEFQQVYEHTQELGFRNLFVQFPAEYKNRKPEFLPNFHNEQPFEGNKFPGH